MKIQTSLVATMAMLGTLAASPLQAQLFSNLGTGPTGVGTSLGLGFDQIDRSKAVGLTIGPDAYMFTSMRAILGTVGDDVDVAVTGGIYSDASSAPSSLLAAFETNTLVAGQSDAPFTFTTLNPFQLNANTTYWFLLDGPEFANGSAWREIIPNTTAASGYSSTDVRRLSSHAASFEGFRFSSDGGTTWGVSGITNAVELNATVVATVVPEPSTYAMLAFGMLALVAMRRRQQRLTR